MDNDDWNKDTQQEYARDIARLKHKLERLIDDARIRKYSNILRHEYKGI